MNIKKSVKTLLAGFVLPLIILSASFPCFATATSSMSKKTKSSLQEKLNSSDIKISEKAKSGAVVYLIGNPEEYEAGELLILSVAALLKGLNIGLGATDIAVSVAKIRTDFQITATKAAKIDNEEMRVKLIEKEVGATLEELGNQLGMTIGKKVTKKVAEKLLTQGVSHATGLVIGDVIGIATSTAGLVTGVPALVDNLKELYELSPTWASLEKTVALTVTSPELMWVEEVSQDWATAAELVKNNEFTNGFGSDWQIYNAYVTSSFGTINSSPTLSKDGVFAVAHTGVGIANNLGYIQQQIVVPKSSKAVYNMLYNFVTCEYPVWHQTEYNDYYKVTITGPSGEMVFKKQEAQNDIPGEKWQTVQNLPANVIEGWEGQSGGHLGWKIYSSSAKPFKKGIYTLKIEVHDVGDDVVDSAILVDKVSLK